MREHGYRVHSIYIHSDQSYLQHTTYYQLSYISAYFRYNFIYYTIMLRYDTSNLAIAASSPWIRRNHRKRQNPWIGCHCSHRSPQSLHDFVGREKKGDGLRTQVAPSDVFWIFLEFFIGFFILVLHRYSTFHLKDHFFSFQISSILGCHWWSFSR